MGRSRIKILIGSRRDDVLEHEIFGKHLGTLKFSQFFRIKLCLSKFATASSPCIVNQWKETNPDCVIKLH